jgi:hypothetical protein
MDFEFVEFASPLLTPSTLFETAGFTPVAPATPVGVDADFSGSQMTQHDVVAAGTHLRVSGFGWRLRMCPERKFAPDKGRSHG